MFRNKLTYPLIEIVDSFAEAGLKSVLYKRDTEVDLVVENNEKVIVDKANAGKANAVKINIGWGWVREHMRPITGWRGGGKE